MILLLGANSYFGHAFADELRHRKGGFIPLTRRALDYTRFEVLFDYVRKIRPEFVINAEEIGEADVQETLETNRRLALQINTILPQTIARVCVMTNTPWGHVSSGSIYSGAKMAGADGVRIERDLQQPALNKVFERHPEYFFGFTEADEPNCSFHSTPCTFYTGTKALAEEALGQGGQNYLWRLRLPFNEEEDPRNWLARLGRARQCLDGINSLSHLEDSVRACLDLWERKAPFGIYNVTNPGAVTTRKVVEMMRRYLSPSHLSTNATDAEELDGGAGELPEPNCILDVSKLLRTGVRIRNVREALESALEKWQPSLNPLQTADEVYAHKETRESHERYHWVHALASASQ